MKKKKDSFSWETPPKKRSVARGLRRGVLLMLAAVVLLVAGYLVVQIWQAPKITEVDAIPHGYRTTILDSSGEERDILYVSESNRIYAELEQIPEDLQNAFVAIEDARFYQHGGIDVQGIGRAFVRGVQNGFHFSEGASTITQQLLKNNVFTDWMLEETFTDRASRKVQEMYLACRLEKSCSKEWILENYLNTINLGGGTRGVQVAAQYYFGKDVSELSLSECALIAGITKSPSAYNPLNHGERSLERQGLVLAAMREQGYITEEEYTAAKAEDVLSGLVREHDGRQDFDWFEDALLRSVVADLGEQYGYDEEAAWELLYGGGLTIYSTEDMDLQAMCERKVSSQTLPQGGEELSLVLTEVKSGAVVALVGGREEKAGSLVYNRATDAQRQPGSTIKIIGEYAAALDEGLITLGTAMDDAPCTYSDGTPLHNATGTYDGMTTVRQAISQSCNVLALKTYQLVGQADCEDYLRRFGISTLDGSDYANEALAIGGTYHGVTNLELTAAYNAIANGGVYQKPHYYTRVEDHNGNVILSYDETGERVIQEETAALLTLAMEDVMENGTGQLANLASVQVAGKSGTTNDKRDLWFVGYSSRYTCGVWGGYDDNTAQTDGNYVKYLWKAVMEEANTGTGKKLVDTSELTKVDICTKCGKLAVDGLCEDTLQGDMCATEYFVPGTEPTETCDCHVRLTVCQESGKTAGSYCPLSDRETGVYLTGGTAGTADEAYSAEGISGTTCDVHDQPQDFFSHFFGEDDTGEEPWNEEDYDETPSEDDFGESDSGWSEGIGWLWDRGREFAEDWFW